MMKCQIDRVLSDHPKCDLPGDMELAMRTKTKEGKYTGKSLKYFLCVGHADMFLNRVTKALEGVPHDTQIKPGPDGLEAVFREYW